MSQPAFSPLRPTALLRPPSWQRRIMKFAIFGLLFTGLAQMPLFKRYYLADVPGFGWTADFYASHMLHYGLATILLAWLSYRGTVAVAAWMRGWRPSALEICNGLLWLGIAATGIARVAKNTPGFFFTPTTTMLIDWVHLALPFLLAPVAWITGRRSSRTI